MPASPKISVLIPTYNYARYLSEAIDSVLSQSFSDFEVIIADDCSNDGTAELLQTYAARDARIRVQIHSVNKGMVANWNGCLADARGEYIKYLFGDDCLTHRDALSRLANVLDETPRVVLAGSARQVIDEESRPKEIWSRLDEGVLNGRELIIRCLWRDNNLIGEPTAVMFRRAAALRGFDESLRQIVDLEMWFHLLVQGNFYYTSEPLCGFRVHSTQQTAQNRAQNIGPRESLQVLMKYVGTLSKGEPKLGLFAAQRICYRCLYYSRKCSPRNPEILALESQLAAMQPMHWRVVSWLLHRVTKPWINLARFAKRIRQTDKFASS